MMDMQDGESGTIDGPGVVRPVSVFADLTGQARRCKIGEKLNKLLTWKPDDLREELRSWPHHEVLDLWGLLETTFEMVCRRYGMMSSRSRVGITGIRLHKQILRLQVVQEVAGSL